MSVHLHTTISRKTDKNLEELARTYGTKSRVIEKAIEYIISRVTRGGKGKIKMIKSLLKNEHPCEYAIFLTKFLEEKR